MKRLPTMFLTLSAAGLVSLAANEGFRGQAYIPVPGDVPTIGFGTTQGVRMGDTIDPVSALNRKMVDVQAFEGALKRCVKVPLSQAEYDVYVDFAYNIGQTGFCTSTVVRRLNQQNYTGACDAILMWKMFNGFDCSTPGNKVCSGLWTRRLEAHSKCMAAQ